MTALQFLSEEEKKQIEEAIVEAESRTSAEIVCAVATASGRYDRGAALMGIVMGIVFLGLGDLILSVWGGEAGGWSTGSGMAFVWQAIAVSAGFLVGQFLTKWLPALRRLVVADLEMEREVYRGAAQVFAEEQIFSTRCAGGLLVYISLFERRVVVLADRAALEAVGQPFLETLRDVAIEHLKKGDRGQTLLSTVQQASEKLSQELPKSGDFDELPNHVLCFHPCP